MSNSGSSDADGTTVSDPVPSGIASQSWTCTATGTAACARPRHRCGNRCDLALPGGQCGHLHRHRTGERNTTGDDQQHRNRDTAGRWAVRTGQYRLAVQCEREYLLAAADRDHQDGRRRSDHRERHVPLHGYRNQRRICRCERHDGERSDRHWHREPRRGRAREAAVRRAPRAAAARSPIR